MTRGNEFYHSQHNLGGPAQGTLNSLHLALTTDRVRNTVDGCELQPITGEQSLVFVGQIVVLMRQAGERSESFQVPFGPF
jgi:hypothetical protein